MECKICEELMLNNDKISIIELYENTTGYFHPENEIIIKFCPVCGRKLTKGEKLNQ